MQPSASLMQPARSPSLQRCRVGSQGRAKLSANELASSATFITKPLPSVFEFPNIMSRRIRDAHAEKRPKILRSILTKENGWVVKAEGQDRVKTWTPERKHSRRRLGASERGRVSEAPPNRAYAASSCSISAARLTTSSAIAVRALSVASSSFKVACRSLAALLSPSSSAQVRRVP
jgi:hypothetical protein